MATTRARRNLIPKKLQVQIFHRDRWLCCWCKRPVIFAPVMKYLQRELRQLGEDGRVAYYHAHWTRDGAPLLDELGAVIDHVDAFSSGGGNTPDNLATACNKCNVQKRDASREDWGKRRKRKPVKGKYGEPQTWDGLSMLFVMLAQRDRAALTANEKDWLKALLRDTP